MSRNKVCSTCLFWSRGDDDIGDCRIEPPKIVDSLVPDSPDGSDIFHATRFPSTASDESCAKWTRKSG
jgi:hypothetical protein